MPHKIPVPAISLADLAELTADAITHLISIMRVKKRPLTKREREGQNHILVDWESENINAELGQVAKADQKRYLFQMTRLIDLVGASERPRAGRRLGKPELMDRLALIEELGTQASAVFAEALAGGLNGEAATPAGIAAARSLMAAGGMMGGAVRRARRKRIVDVRWRQGELALEEKG